MSLPQREQCIFFFLFSWNTLLLAHFLVQNFPVLHSSAGTFSPFLFTYTSISKDFLHFSHICVSINLSSNRKLLFLCLISSDVNLNGFNQLMIVFFGILSFKDISLVESLFSVLNFIALFCILISYCIGSPLYF